MAKNKEPNHPGVILLKEFIEPANITQKDLVLHLGWTYARLNEIVKGKRGITASSALALADTFGNIPEYWLDLQRNRDLWCAKQSHTPVSAWFKK